jgi:sulfite exporter TauE/SafE
VLGLSAGVAGERVRDLASAHGWQRAGSFVLSIAVLGSGLLLAGLLPGGSAGRRLGRCAIGRFGGRAWFDALLHARGPLARMLLGATMGLLPCGLVYAMLAAVAALPSPLHAAAGMLVFGAGTVPSLSAVLLAGRVLPARWRAQGTRVAAACLIAAGVLMLARTILVHPATETCPLHAGAISPAQAGAVDPAPPRR